MPMPMKDIPVNAAVRVQEGAIDVETHPADIKIWSGIIVGAGSRPGLYKAVTADQVLHNDIPVFSPDSITTEDQKGLGVHGVLCRIYTPLAPVVPRPPELTNEEITTRFTYHSMSPHGQRTAALIRTGFEQLARTIVNVTPPSRELSLALTKMEEASFWAIAGLARSPARGVEMPKE